MSHHGQTLREHEQILDTGQRLLTLALAGQPNVGKSTVFNMLTGLNQHVGNWPGKTVERRTGILEHHGQRAYVVDLPGTYSLTAASPEEAIAREFIINERPDVVVVVLNAACLERNLYLVAELLALPAPLVIGLNMLDVAKQEGFEVEPQVLSAAIGVPVVPMVASRGEGVHDLVDAALLVAAQRPAQEPNRPQIRDEIQPVLARVEELVHGYVPEPYPTDWMAIKALEGDREVLATLEKALPPERWSALLATLAEHEDAVLAIAGGRYDWIRRMTRAALRRPRAGQITLTQHLDAIATHPFWGLVLLAVVVAATFGLTYAVGGPLQGLAEQLIGDLARLASSALAGAPFWVSGLIVDGLIGGVGTMFTFLPILLIFFTCMGLLEDVGYMARAAFIMDRFMHAVGLHGKSFLPLFLGFGCNVPAIMGTRVIDSPKSRLLTIMLAPLVPCTARLAVLAVLVPAFFGRQATLVSWGLTALPLLVLALAGATVGRWLIRGEEAAFIMEMPLYHVPNARTIGLFVWMRLLGFLRKATTVILAVSVIIWLLSALPHGDVETSILSIIGRALEPVGALMGLGWRPLVALLTSFVAKENTIATLGVLYGVAEGNGTLGTVLATHIPTASALAFLVAQMLFIPCVATVAVIRQETNSWKWTLLNVLGLIAVTLLGGIAAYQLSILLA